MKWPPFRINVKSLPEHHDELELYINSLTFSFYHIIRLDVWIPS